MEAREAGTVVGTTIGTDEEIGNVGFVSIKDSWMKLKSVLQNRATIIYMKYKKIKNYQ